MMEVKVISRKLIKPSSPTPDALRNFQIFFTDEMSPTMNVPLILFYINKNCTTDQGTISKLKQTLETSLAQILPQFYPLCGRYIESNRLIDCSDQGVLYLEAEVSYRLHPLFEQQAKVIKPEQLNDLLPWPFGAADGVTDPLLSVQVRVFECGGVSIGICISHRIADAVSLSTFLLAWASSCSSEQGIAKFRPIFNSSHFFPGRNLPKFGVGISKTMEKNQFSDVPKVLTRTFVFSGKAVSGLRSKFQMIAGSGRYNHHQSSKVQLVSAIILRAFLAIDRANYGRSRGSFVIQAVNFRSITCPPIPDHSFGNFCVFALAECSAQQTKTMDFQDCVNVVSDAVKKTVCEKILKPKMDGHMVVINPFNKVIQTLSSSSDLNAVILNSWCRFPFYEADFGWGKPIWVSVASLPARNSVVMMDTKDGDGVEAWVSLDEKDMSKFQQDQDIQMFTIGWRQMDGTLTSVH